MLKLMGNKIFTVFAQKFVYLYQYYFSYFSTKTYDVGTQKNCLNEMILLRAKTNDKIDGLKIIYNFSLNNFIYLNLRISKILLNPCLLVSSADDLCKQFRPRAGPTECRAWSGSKQFDTLMVILKEFFEKNEFERKPADDKKQ